MLMGRFTRFTAEGQAEQDGIWEGEINATTFAFGQVQMLFPLYPEGKQPHVTFHFGLCRIGAGWPRKPKASDKPIFYVCNFYGQGFHGFQARLVREVSTSPDRFCLYWSHDL